MQIYNNIIIGGGASGLFLASRLDPNKTIILEKNSRCGLKILASGGGRCNITNRKISANNYLGEAGFVEQILSNTNTKEVLGYFDGLEFLEQKQSQFYSKSGSKAVLAKILSKVRAKIITNCEVLGAFKDGENFIVQTNLGEFAAINLIVASGGLSYKSLGATGIGYEIANSFGHKISATAPALVGFTAQKDEFWFKQISGVSLYAVVQVGDRKWQDSVLFTHKGISGPAILNASLFWSKGQISINFAPTFSPKLLSSTKKHASTILELPRSFARAFLSAKNLPDAPFDSLNPEQKAKFCEIFNYKFAPAGTFGFERAEITKGGIVSDELDENCQSKLVRGLYFIGEVLEVSGMLGGFNLHFAFASAKAASNGLKRSRF